MRGTLGRSARSRVRAGMVVSVMAALMVAASIATVQAGSAANSVKKNMCPPASPPGTVFNGGLEVVGQCVLTGVTINGGVQIDSKGHLTLYDSTVNGRTDVAPNGEFDSNFPEKGLPNTLNGGMTSTNPIDMDLHGDTIRGNVVFDGMTPGNGAIVSFCGVDLRGNLTVKNFLPGPFANFPNGAQIGDSDVNPDYAAPCTPNRISGSVQIRNNDPRARIELETNTIGGSVQITDSNPSVTGNTIGGSLQCHEGATLGHWDADDMNTNNVHGTNTCGGSTRSRNQTGAGGQHGTNAGNSSVKANPVGGSTTSNQTAAAGHTKNGKGKKK